MVSALLFGAGEYVAGYVPTAAGAAVDKPAGVVALTCFDLRRFGKVGRVVLCDRRGSKMPAVRATMQAKIGDVYRGMDCSVECFPPDDVALDEEAYLKAIASMSAGDVAIIFTPDDTHFTIAAAAIRSRLHVLIAKPAVKTLKHHLELAALADEFGVLVCVEFHKRFDPIYSDARNRVRNYGPCTHFSAYMSQPKKQLDTFAAWAGLSSDISYYLNSHHIDFHSWCVAGSSRPVRVVASAASGVAEQRLGRPCEDCITLMVTWQQIGGSAVGTALYTACWTAPKSDVHSQQQFHYLAATGEVRVDQAHRGYTGATDADGYASLNPLYMRYTPDARGYFAGQNGYGYVSIARFIDAAAALSAGSLSMADVLQEDMLATMRGTLVVTAILEAGRRSLDAGGAPVEVVYGEDGCPVDLKV